ncbi:MAG: lipoprotein [Bacteroidetes bacterium]|nr:lipoprotein [Bacteroidota bacterium]
MRKVFLVFFALLILAGCSVLQTVQNVSRLKYRIDSATDYRVAGIFLSDKKNIRDFSSIEMLKLTAGLAKGTLPLTFLLNVEAKNLNDGSGSYPRTDLTLISFPWRLLLNNKETVKGNINEPVFVPGKGKTVLIPIRIEFDIAKSFKDKSIDDVLMLLLQIEGVKNSTSNLKLLARPIVGTPFGNLAYPDEITIVDKIFN